MEVTEWRSENICVGEGCFWTDRRHARRERPQRFVREDGHTGAEGKFVLPYAKNILFNTFHVCVQILMSILLVQKIFRTFYSFNPACLVSEENWRLVVSDAELEVGESTAVWVFFSLPSSRFTLPPSLILPVFPLVIISLFFSGQFRCAHDVFALPISDSSYSFFTSFRTLECLSE